MSRSNARGTLGIIRDSPGLVTLLGASDHVQEAGLLGNLAQIG